MILEVINLDNVNVSPDAKVRVKEMGNVTEIMYSDSYASKCSIKKLDSENYLDLESGEIKQFKKMETRACDTASVRKSLGRLRDYINTNVVDVDNCKWVTLTYKENMTDTKRLYNDFKKFNQRFKYKYGSCEYIVSMEPQGRGAWHAHVIFIFPCKAPFIPNTEMASIWGHGFTTTKKLDDVDNIGAYLTAYLGDISLENAIDLNLLRNGDKVKDVECSENISKKYVKGARLRLYPPQFNLYRCSRGIKKPITYYDIEKNAQKKVSTGMLTFEKSIQLKSADCDFSKILSYRYYNKLKQDNQV